MFGTLNNIGLLYSKQHKLKKAEELFCQALPGAKEILGPDHMVTLTTISNTGDVYYHQGKLGRAEEMYCRVLRGYEKRLGPDHIRTLDTMHNM